MERDKHELLFQTRLSFLKPLQAWVHIIYITPANNVNVCSVIRKGG